MQTIKSISGHRSPMMVDHNRATLAAARKIVCDLLAVEPGQRDFMPAEEFARTAAA